VYVKFGELVVLQLAPCTDEPTVKISETTPPFAKPFLSAMASSIRVFSATLS